MDQDLQMVDLNNLVDQWVAVEDMDIHKQRLNMACHLKIAISMLNRITTIRSKTNNSSITIRDSKCLNSEIKATWNTKLQRGTKTNIARRMALKTLQMANQLHPTNISTKTHHKQINKLTQQQLLQPCITKINQVMTIIQIKTINDCSFDNP